VEPEHLGDLPHLEAEEVMKDDDVALAAGERRDRPLDVDPQLGRRLARRRDQAFPCPPLDAEAPETAPGEFNATVVTPRPQVPDVLAARSAPTPSRGLLHGVLGDRAAPGQETHGGDEPRIRRVQELADCVLVEERAPQFARGGRRYLDAAGHSG
jgi:hypothetical protein